MRSSGRRYKKWLVATIVALAIASCQTNDQNGQLKLSVWGSIITIGTAEQLVAPTVWVSENRLTAAWVGADETGIHHDARILSADGLLERVVLPLPPHSPRSQQLIASTNGNLHLFWLDQNDEGQPRLFAALISPELTVLRGPIQVTDEATYQYTVLSNRDGSAWVISSGGETFQPRLYAHYIDHEGRPIFQESYELVTDANWPAVSVANDGTAYLYWIQPSNGQVKRANLVNGRAEHEATISGGVAINKGDRLVGFHAGLDRTHEYVFWNVTRSNGLAETWFTSGEHESENWDNPQRLGIVATTRGAEPGFNVGPVQASTAGNEWLRWTTVLSGQYDTVAAATVFPTGDLGIVYFQGGQPIGVQKIVTGTYVIGTPAIQTDRDRFLYLAWSEPSTAGYAHLLLTTSRRSP